mgnify:CR=1 FL=1
MHVRTALLAALAAAAPLAAAGPATRAVPPGATLVPVRPAGEAALSAAATTAPRDVRSQALLARLRFMRGDPDYTRELAAAASRFKEPALRLALGDLLRRGGQREAAENIVRSLLAEQGWAPQPAAALAVLLQEQGRLDEAEQQARRASAARPDDPVLAENMVAILLQRGEAREALERAQRERHRAPHALLRASRSARQGALGRP